MLQNVVRSLLSAGGPNSAFVICSSYYLFFESPENKFTDENSVHDKKKLLPLKCVINDMSLAVRVTSCRL